MRLPQIHPEPPDVDGHRLCIERLAKRYPGAETRAVDEVSFCVSAGEILTLVGPSGCGKTTLLRSIAGLERPDEGYVRHGNTLCQNADTFLAPEKRGIGFVFQDYALFPHLSVIQNVRFGLRHGSKKERTEIAREAMHRVGLHGLENRRVQELSGGQQQRVAFARALAPGTDVLLLDEPFSNLDTELRIGLRKSLQELVQRGDLGVILVTHDQEEAMSIADRIAVMRDGQLLQIGPPPSLYSRPRSAFVAKFLGNSNLMTGQAQGNFAETPIGRVEIDRHAEGPVTLSLRPEHLSFDMQAGVNTPATITLREFKGHDLTYHVRHGEGTYLIQTTGGSLYDIGDAVHLKPTSAAVVVEDDLSKSPAEA
ncbi:ABC transporter ATP-binding protein [Algisphaera agarilytica]|uniref:Iron(III) transport system ATP-binding protein n=1 Tax=Algisphaera agarilytica TaxID=1385975 RepID=A0A7X0HBY0_9BACT|nr:ABC transporter ATP-binding protein [Algisphaera agarilytica]MBB6431604.1 iron(III) transport system ATP-binding protein [Algisphaera agarilytica]